MSGGGLGAHLRAHPVAWGGGGVTVLAAAVVVLVWFQPQALLFDRVVDDGFPGPQAASDQPPADSGDGEGGDPATDATPAEPSEPAADTRTPAEPRALSSGAFTSRNRYTVTGAATVYELEDGSRTLRLEDFESTNGPDLFVYLTAADSADTDPDLDADFVDLGVLRGNIGNQNYAIPPDVDLDRYDTVAIWCRRFSTGFGAADLAPAG